MNMLVVTMYNIKQGFNVFVHQISRNEFKIKQQLGVNSFTTEFCYGLHELAKILFVLYINGFEMMQNNLGYDFAHAVHSGNFSELEEENKRQNHLSDRMTQDIDEDDPLCRTQSIEEYTDENMKNKNVCTLPCIKKDKNEIK